MVSENAAAPGGGRGLTKPEVTKRFGRVRDLDVSKQNLLAAAKVADGLGKKEKKAVKKIAGGLQDERERALQKVVRKGLSKKVLKSVYKGSSVLKDDRLDAQSAAALDVRGAAVVPMLTLPLWSEVLLHPAWHSDPFGADLEASGEVIAMTEQMHDLRKTIRELRYLTDLSRSFDAGNGTGPASKKVLKELIQWQETLGDMHDLQVLHDQLHTYDIDRFPAIARSVERRYIAKALAWQRIRGDMLEQGIERDYSRLVEPATRSAAPAAALGTPSIPPSTATAEMEPVSVTVEDDLQAMLVPELKRRLRERGLPVSGRKAELVARLSRCQQAWRAGAQAVADKAVETLRWVGEP